MISKRLICGIVLAFQNPRMITKSYSLKLYKYVMHQYSSAPPSRFSVRTVSVMYSTVVEAQPPVVTRAQIVTTESLDREETQSYQFILTASDQSLAPLSAFIPVSIDVGEINDNTPMFTSPNFSFSISEDTTSSFISQFVVRALC